MTWTFKHGAYCMQLDECVWAPVLGYIDKAGRKETGGILMGSYSKDHTVAIITEFSDAPLDSEAGFFWFLRGNRGLKKILADQWKKGLYYLGEWHFHPYALPTPSSQDLTQMRKIARSKKYACPEPILIIVGGHAEAFAVRSFVFPKSGGEMFELLKVE